MQTISLFDSGEFVLEPDGILAAAALESGLFDDLTADEPAGEQAALQAEPDQPRYRERDILQAMITERNSVVVQKVGNKGVSVTAADFESALTLLQFKQGGALTAQASLFPKFVVGAEEGWNTLPRLTDGHEVRVVAGQSDEDKTIFPRVRVYFDIKDCIAPTFRESKVCRFLESLGVVVVAPPSFENWIPRAFRRQERDNTPFLLPDVLDSRPLYERLEEGTVIKCTTSVSRFQKDKEYIVGQKSPANEEAGQNGFVMLHQYERGRAYSYAVRWEDIEVMEPYFEAVQQQELIYEAEKCVPTVYKEAFELNRRRIEKEKWQLFDHTSFDAAQAAVKPHYFNGKPMRMGKSRESIVFHKLRGNRRIGVFCPKNVSGFFAREFDALKINDYRIVDSHKILNNEAPQPWAEILPYGWMKYKKDPSAADGWTAFPKLKGCPHCGQTLERKAYFAAQPTPDNPNPKGAWIWNSEYGYICRNEECQYQQQVRAVDTKPYGNVRRSRKKNGLPVDKRDGAAWWEEAPNEPILHAFSIPKTRAGDLARLPSTPRRGSGYVDLGRKAHVAHMFDAKGEEKSKLFHGRQCRECGYVAQTWVPAPYRRLKKRYDGLILDELHGCKSGTSDITLAVLSLHARSVAGLTGTLMPNDPSDAFWPLFRMFGNNTHRFPYAKTPNQPHGGLAAYNSDFTDSLTIESTDKDAKYKKKIPYIKNPVRFWRMLAPKMIRRTYEDPLVVESLAKAGLKVPKADRKLIVVPPDPKQAALMLASMQEFDQQFREYREQLKNRGTEDRTYLLNSAYVISRMTRLRMGATCPDYINEKLAAAGMPPLYMGARGGAKMEQVYNIVLSKRAKGEKVLVLSDFRSMQRVMAEELALFKPIVFDTSWDRGKRQEAFDQFNEDPDAGVFIAGPRAIGLGVDLAGGPDSLCRTVVSTDLLWRPGEQLQAWARIMKHSKEDYTVEQYVLLVDATIDLHVYNTFYGKLFAAEQALDRKVISTKERAFDVGKFVDQVLSDRDKMLEYLQRGGESELSYMPYVEMFAMEDREV